MLQSSTITNSDPIARVSHRQYKASQSWLCPIKLYLQKQVACHRPSQFANPWSKGFPREAQKPIHVHPSHFITLMYLRGNTGKKTYDFYLKQIKYLCPRKLVFSHRSLLGLHTPYPGRNQLIYSSMSHLLVWFIPKDSQIYTCKRHSSKIKLLCSPPGLATY